MATNISNQASVSFGYEGSTETVTNESNVVSAVINDEYGFNLELTSSSTSYRPGETITYFVKITNTGSASLSNIVVSDDMAGGVINYISGTAQMIYSDNITPLSVSSENPLEMTLPITLPAGDSVIVTYNTSVGSTVTARTTEIVNTVTVSALGGSQTITETASLTLTIEEYADVTIEKYQNTDNVNIGGTMIYTLVLTNKGNLDAENVVISDQLPSQFNVVSIVSDNNGNVHTYGSDEYTVSGTKLLTLPTGTGTPIVVPSDDGTGINTTVITITGTLAN